MGVQAGARTGRAGRAAGANSVLAAATALRAGGGGREGGRRRGRAEIPSHVGPHALAVPKRLPPPHDGAGAAPHGAWRQVSKSEQRGPSGSSATVRDGVHAEDAVQAVEAKGALDSGDVAGGGATGVSNGSGTWGMFTEHGFLLRPNVRTMSYMVAVCIWWGSPCSLPITVRAGVPLCPRRRLRAAPQRLKIPSQHTDGRFSSRCRASLWTCCDRSLTWASELIV